ncbi:MAG: hypothetical protein ACRDEA_21225 [Microcystaceae cyanobacterium]
MDAQVKITIRLDAALCEEFQSKLKRGGWNATKLLTQLIREFVQKEETPWSNAKKRELNSAPESVPNRETLTVLNEEICRLNQRIEQIEKAILQ